MRHVWRRTILRKERSINKKPIPTHKQRKELKMAKSKNRIKKMTFQTQERTFDMNPLSEDDKYVIEMSGYKKGIGLQPNENLQRITRGSTRPQYI